MVLITPVDMALESAVGILEAALNGARQVW